MKRTIIPGATILSTLLLLSTIGHSADTPRPVGTGNSFKGPLGLQLYSLREQFAKDVTGTLDRVRDLGIQYVE